MTLPVLKLRRFQKLFFIFLLLCFAFTTSGYALSSVEGSKFHLFLFVPIMGMCFFLLLSKRLSLIIAFRGSLTLFLILLFSSLLSTMVNANLPNVLALAKYWLVITFAFLLSSMVSKQKAILYFINTMAMLTSVSLFVYVLVNFLSIDLPLVKYTNVKDMPYLSGYFFFVYDNHLTYRNMGPFWEPGIFGSYLTLALILLVSNDIPYKKVLFFLFGLGLISTMSTASTIYLAMVLTYCLTIGYSGLLIRFFVLIIALVSLIVIYLNISTLILMLAEFMPSLFSKFMSTESASISERVTSPLTNLELFSLQPGFGFGLAQQLDLYRLITNAAQTSTSTYFLASFGIFGLSYSIYWLYGILSLPRLSLTSKFLLIVFATSILNKEPHYYFTITFIVLFYLTKNEFETVNVKPLSQYGRRS